jgi:stress response protein YsnF
MSGRADPYEADHRDVEVRWVHHGADVSRAATGWRITVPLRQEHVEVRREVVTTKEFRVSTRLTEERAEFRERPRADEVSAEAERRSR